MPVFHTLTPAGGDARAAPLPQAKIESMDSSSPPMRSAKEVKSVSEDESWNFASSPYWTGETRQPPRGYCLAVRQPSPKLESRPTTRPLKVTVGRSPSPKSLPSTDTPKGMVASASARSLHRQSSESLFREGRLGLDHFSGRSNSTRSPDRRGRLSPSASAGSLSNRSALSPARFTSSSRSLGADVGDDVVVPWRKVLEYMDDSKLTDVHKDALESFRCFAEEAAANLELQLLTTRCDRVSACRQTQNAHFKHSQKLLNLRIIEKRLARNQEYSAAATKKQEADELQSKEENDHAAKLRKRLDALEESQTVRDQAAQNLLQRSLHEKLWRLAMQGDLPEPVLREACAKARM